MSITSESWVPAAVQQILADFEAQENCGYTDLDRELWTRLVTDLRMRPFYENEYLVQRLSDQGWKGLFYCIWKASTEDFEDARTRLKEHQEKLKRLEKYLTQAAELMEEIHDLGAMDQLPESFHCPFALIERTATKSQYGEQQTEMKVLYTRDIAPLLLSVQSFPDWHYPSVTMLLETLSEQTADHARQIEKQGPNAAYPYHDNALTARQYSKKNPLPFFVRHVDGAMQSPGYESDTSGCDFLIPPLAMAAVASVVLGDGTKEYEAKQVYSAR